MKRKIPSGWTKKMFLSASFYAMTDADVNVRYGVAHDLHDIALFGFWFWRNLEFGEYSVDYTKYKTDLFLS